MFLASLIEPFTHWKSAEKSGLFEGGEKRLITVRLFRYSWSIPPEATPRFEVDRLEKRKDPDSLEKKFT